MTLKLRLIGQFLWQYLNQPLFCRETQFVLRMDRFWQVYRLQMLERCWSNAYPFTQTSDRGANQG